MRFASCSSWRHATCGFVRISFISNKQIAPSGLPAPFVDGRPAGSALYFMVTPDAPVRLHRLCNDQLYHYYLGDPTELLMLYESGATERAIVGPDLRAGRRVQLLIPGNTFHTCARDRPAQLVPRREHRVARRRTSRYRDRRCGRTRSKISKRRRQPANVLSVAIRGGSPVFWGAQAASL
jgi:predicted cupin superfamily sugar epimerase